MLFLIAPSIFLTYYRTFFRRHDTRNSSPLDIFSPHSKFTAPQSPSHVNYPPGSRDGTIARSSKDYLFIQRDNHGRGDRSTRRVSNRRREEIRSNEKKWSRRRIVNTGANRQKRRTPRRILDECRSIRKGSEVVSTKESLFPCKLEQESSPFSRLPVSFDSSPVKRGTIAILLGRVIPSSFPRIEDSRIVRIARFNDLQNSVSPVFVHRVYHRFAPIERANEAKNGIPIKSGVKQKTKKRERERMIQTTVALDR